MDLIAEGPLKAKADTEPLSAVADRSGLHRASLDKQFSGDLEAISQGEMLTFRSSVQGSGAYVAMETVRGTLQGRRGSFVLLHRGTMVEGAMEASITVAPDSGTEALSGLRGMMYYIHGGDGHSYQFHYALQGL